MPAIRDPKAIVITPANANRAPASTSRDAVSSGAILNSSYAILIAGDALPHNTQQNIADKTTMGMRVKIEQSRVFCFIIYALDCGKTFV